MTIAGLTYPDPPLTDGIVVLNPLSEADLDDLVLAQDAEAKRWLPLPDPYTRADAVEYLARGAEALAAGRRLQLAVRDEVEGRLQGTISLQLERLDWEGAIGYSIAPWARGRGLATRASLLVARHGLRDLGLRRIEILVQPDNFVSRAVARSTGAVYEGIRREGILFLATGQSFDAAVYALVRSDVSGGA